MVPIKVFLVEDSAVALFLIKKMLKNHPEIEVVGTAADGVEALKLIPKTQPNVVCTDLHMPRMGGLELTQQIMAHDPRPILAISASVLQGEDPDNIFNLLQAGAVDVFPKPRGGVEAYSAGFEQDLVRRIRILSGVTVFKRKGGVAPGKTPSKPAQRELTPPCKFSEQVARVELIALGASTGGPVTLNSILSLLPATFPCPILCVQHISLGFLQGLVDWLDEQGTLRVKTAEQGEIPQPGTVYFPPEDRHLELDSGGRLTPTARPKINGHRPSVDVTFASVAAYYGPRALGMLLTGMGNDGAQGLLVMRQAGGVTVAQDEPSCVVYGMPKQAVERGAAEHVLSPERLVQSLIELDKGRK